MGDARLELFARCAGGFESVLADELRGLGMSRVRPLNGGVSFFGSRRDAYVACLWSRVATRIQLVLARIPAADADELYDSVVSFPWEKHVRDGATIAVVAHGTNQNLRNTQFTALKVKDALCDRLREVRGSRPDVDAKQPGFAVSVALHDVRATLQLDLSGESLHRRGYREAGVQSEAPLKETLAAGILLAAGWPALARAGGALVDPMCGSGTFAIEGAMIAADKAPGLLRERWGFEGWVRHDHQLWVELLADARLRSDSSYTDARIIAGDIDEQVIGLARANAARAGVDGLVSFDVDDAAQLSRHLRRLRGGPGILVANPPYGMRLLGQEDLPKVNETLATAVAALPKGWSAAIITPDLGIDTALGRLPDRLITCFNGPIETWVHLYDLDATARQTLEVISLGGVRHIVPVADEASAQFASRLRKVGKERARWARREGVACYRVYDADLPEYAVSVDLFCDACPDEGRRMAVIREHPRSRRVDIVRAGRRFADAVALTCAVLDIDDSDAVRIPWQSDASYARTQRSDTPVRMACVKDGPYRLAVDLMGAVGKGPSLEHRLLCEFVSSRANGVRFANLFATANVATVYAAGAGARSTVTVDTSKERLEWVSQALRDNGLLAGRHVMACSDVLTWLKKEVRARHTYDLVLCAPPTNLAAHGERGAWDVSRDLDELLRLVKGTLSDDGLLVLLLPAQAVVPDDKTLSRLGLSAEDTSARMVPHDFERSREHPTCLVMRRVQD